jgi:predicted phage terminase large subunit-like protein
MEYVTARHCRTGIGWEDPRKKEGELLFPERFPREVVESDKRILGSSGFAGQDQQLPMPAEGGMFKKHWWRFWRLPNQPDLPGFETRTVVLPAHFDEQLLSLDCAFKKLEDNSKVCGGVWARAGARKFLLGCEWDFMDFTETCAAFMRLVAKYPGAHAKLIEDKANGPAVITTFKAKVSGIIAVEPHGGKESRAAATSPQVEAGDIFLPLHWDKRDAYIDEHAAFPKGTRNDAVDMQSQALTRWIKKPFEYAGQPANLPQRRV